MKIAIVTDFHISDYSGGGEVRYFELLSRLVKKGHSVGYYCCGSKKGTVVLDGITVHTVFESKPFEQSVFTRLWFGIVILYKLLFSSYTYIEGQGAGYFPLFFLQWFKKTAIVIHDVDSGKADQFFSKKNIYAIMERLLYCLPWRKIITVSPFVEKQIRKRLVFPANIFVVANGVSTIHEPQAKQEKSIIFVGRLIAHKHVEDIITALKNPLLKDFTLTVIGNGPQLQQLKHLAKDLSVTFLTNEKSNAVVQKKIATAKVLVLPSTREGFGIVCVEAMASHTPVIAYSGTGVESVIRHGHNGVLIPQRDILGLAGAIEHVCSNQDLYVQLQKRGIETVKKNYLWDTVVNDLEAVYLKL